MNYKRKYKIDLDCDIDDSIYYDFDYDSSYFFKKMRKQIKNNFMEVYKINLCYSEIKYEDFKKNIYFR